MLREERVRMNASLIVADYSYCIPWTRWNGRWFVDDIIAAEDVAHYFCAPGNAERSLTCQCVLTDPHLLVEEIVNVSWPAYACKL